MSYVKAEAVIPKELIQELQKYVQGQSIYVPKAKENHQKWGAKSGERRRIDRRNAEIRERFKKGNPISELADTYYLSPETIKSIVYKTL